MPWRDDLRAWVLGLALVLVGGCATPEPVRWPPEPGGPTKTVYVSLDAWHAVIGFRRDELVDASTGDLRAPSEDASSWEFEEWGYAERAWYLEGRQGIPGVLRALFWPTEGVVEVVRTHRLWADRTAQPPSERFVVVLSARGFQRLRRYLARTKDSSLLARIGSSRFYRARRPYHLLHHCHHYAARALREAGLPISPFWAITRTGLARQLHRVLDEAGEDRHARQPGF